MNYKFVSIIMPVYNAERFLQRAIQSILDQTYKNFELIIIDDGSTDSSSKIIKFFFDERIRSFFFENQGVSKTRNFGISVSRGEFIALMDADDISEPTRIEKQLEYLIKNKEMDIVGANSFLIDMKNKIVGKICYPEFHSSIINKMPVEQSVFHASLLMKKKIYDNLLYESEFEPVEDHRLFLQMIRKGFKFHNIQDYLYSVRSENHFENSIKSVCQKKISYQLGKKFLKEHCSDQKHLIGNTNYYYKIAMLEYNNGFMKSARENFINYLKYSNNKILIVIRYIIPSFLGDKVFKYLREKNISNKLNFILKKIGVETHRF